MYAAYLKSSLAVITTVQALTAQSLSCGMSVSGLNSNHIILVLIDSRTVPTIKSLREIVTFQLSGQEEICLIILDRYNCFACDRVEKILKIWLKKIT